MENYSSHGSSSGDEKAVEMAAVSMEKPSGHFPAHGGVLKAELPIPQILASRWRRLLWKVSVVFVNLFVDATTLAELTFLRYSESKMAAEDLEWERSKISNPRRALWKRLGTM
ncbi:hypothetical protein QYE76_008897 [Lolium multiflorum]|uniref:Uncharacterized protein n=1 Tax=Lolium multiflorum TaxID=4521 RepID=A0AAD8TQX9_LOLMU|nr:hypothetical protein QYE76_008897 [Lolium multiflorum]